MRARYYRRYRFKEKKKGYAGQVEGAAAGQRRINRFLRPVLFFLLFVLAYILLKLFVYNPPPNSISYVNNNFNVLGLNIPSDLSFCGEMIPANDYVIKKSLDKEFYNNSYWKHNSLVLFNKAQRWFPYIEPILKAEGVPDDFKYLCVIESHMSNAYSGAHAAGFWQLVAVSARNYGLEVNDFVDERYHVEKATYAACGHIKDAYRVFRNWTLSAAAYNRGIGGIINALERQGSKNYFDLMLNSETGAFVYRILAYKTLFSSPSHFGIRKKSFSYFPKIAYTNYKVDSSITNLEQFAISIGTSVGTIRLFNPWLLQDRLPNAAGKVYEIRIPKSATADYSGYTRDLLVRQGNLISHLADPSAVAALPADSLNGPMVATFHVVRMDEPLANLARFLNVTEEELRKWNDLKDATTATRGQTLTIYHRVQK